MSIQRLRYNFQTGLLSASLAGSPTATMYLSSTGFGNITVTGAVTSGNTMVSGPYMPITINPASYSTVSGNIGSEIVYVVNYLPNTNSATVLRGQENTASFASTTWNTGTVWSHGNTVQDFGLVNQMTNSDFPAPTASGQVFSSTASGNVAGSWVTPTIPTNSIVTSPIEISSVYATGASGTLNYDVIPSTVHYHTVPASGNITLNVRGNSTTPFGTIVGSGQSMTVVWINTNSGSLTPPPYVSTFQIDGVTQSSIKWQGGANPTQGNVNATDVYSYTIICTTSGNYTVLGSVNKFV